MAICGLLPHLLPEIQALKGVAQDSRHHDEGDVYRHTMLVLKNAPMTPEGQLAALLHDVGKPSSQKFIGDKIQFLGHEEVGAEMAEAILKRLRFGSDVVDKVTRVVRQHMRPHWTSSPEVSEKAIRKFIVDMGQDLEAVLAQAVADRKGMLPYVDDAEQLVKKVTDIKEKDKNLGVQGDKLPLTGFEIMDALGIPKGPKVGEAVRLLQDIQNEYLSNGKPLDKDSAVIELRRRFPSDASVS
jgi:putative nucleotidyltransferase with HDIG domain